MGVRSARIPIALLVLVASLLLLLPIGASAHAAVIATDPVDGARLPVAPAAVSVTFNEAVTLAPGGLRVVRPDGTLADIGDESVTGTVVSQPIEPLADGWYVMAWSIVSEDGHVVHGSATFAVGDADAAVRPAASFGPSKLELGLWLTRGAADLLLLAGVGALFAWVVLGARTPRVARFRGLLLGLAVVTPLAWLLIEVSDAGTAWLSTGYALSGLARIGLLVAAIVALLLRPARERVALALAMLAVATLAAGGHATGSPLTSLTLMVHLIAGVTWLGAAPAVALVLWDRAVEDDTAMRVVRGFSRTATVALVLVIGGGAASALLLTNGLEGGITIYVWIVLLKLSVVGIAALMGFLGRLGLTREASRGRYRRLFLTDAAILMIVAFISSALTLVGPHQGHAGHEGGHGVASPRCATAVGDIGTTVVVDAGTPGTNTLTVTGPPDGAPGVTVSLVHPYAEGAAIDVQLASGPHGWTGSVALPFTGTWTATVAVRVDTFTEATGSCELTIAP